MDFVQQNSNVTIYFCPQCLTLSRLGGGHFLPGSPKIVCHFHVDSATLTKFLDFVSFDVRHVPGSKKNFENFQNITRCQRGDPSKTETRAESAPPQPTTSFQNPAQIGLISNKLLLTFVKLE